MADNNDKKQTPQNPKKNGGPNRPDENFDWSKIIRMVFGNYLKLILQIM